MSRYIDKDLLISDLKSLNESERLEYMGVFDVINSQPDADIVRFGLELRKAVRLLEKNYEKGLNSDYVNNPLAWALYQTCKETDGVECDERK